MQSNLTELLVESNKKLKALESANSILRFELQNSKNKKAINEMNEAVYCAKPIHNLNIIYLYF